MLVFGKYQHDSGMSKSLRGNYIKYQNEFGPDSVFLCIKSALVLLEMCLSLRVTPCLLISTNTINITVDFLQLS